jgi:hypothetical protein
MCHLHTELLENQHHIFLRLLVLEVPHALLSSKYFKASQLSKQKAKHLSLSLAAWFAFLFHLRLPQSFLGDRDSIVAPRNSNSH